MDPVIMKKTNMIMDSRNGDRTLDVLYMTAYLAPGDIPSCFFAQVFPDSSDLKSAIRFLHRLSLVVQASDEASSFSMPNETRMKMRVHLNFLRMEEAVLKNAITLLSGLSSVGYQHLLSVYSHAKLYPSLQLGHIAGRTVFGMLKEMKYREACEFGTECKDFLVKSLGEYHSSVLEVQSFLAMALAALMKREEAIAVLTDVYQKSRQVSEEKEIESAMLKLARLVVEDPCGTPSSSEARLRKIIFQGKTVAESHDASDLDIWLVYCRVLVRIGMLRRAVSYIDEVIDRRRGLFGKDDDGILDALQDKTRCLVVEFRMSEAMELAKSVFEKRKAKLGLENFKTLTSKVDIARILLLRGDFKESIAMFEEVAKDSEHGVGDTRNLYLTCKGDLVGVFRMQKDFEKALKLSSELYNEIVAVHGPYHLSSYDCKVVMGEILMEMGRLQEARACFEEVIGIAPLEEIDVLRFQINLIDNMELYNPPVGSLHWAAMEGQVSTVLSMLDTGCNIEAKDLKGMTALHYASAFGRVQVALELLLRGAKYNCKTPSKTTPLQIAKGLQMKALFKDIHAFFEAVKEGDVDLVLELASKEPSALRARDEHGCNCLHWAALRGFESVFGVLAELGADPSVVTDRRNSPLHIAASKGHVSIAETLLRMVGPSEATAGLDGKTGSGGNTPLHAAAEKGAVGMVRTLLAHGAVYCAANAAGKTPLQLCEDWGCRNLLGLVEGLFSDVAKGDVGAVCGKLRGLESGDALAVSKARNGGHRTLLQEAMRLKRVDLGKKLVKLLKYE